MAVVRVSKEATVDEGAHTEEYDVVVTGIVVATCLVVAPIEYVSLSTRY